MTAVVDGSLVMLLVEDNPADVSFFKEGMAATTTLMAVHAEVKTVRQALMEVQNFIDQSIGRPGDKSSPESGKPMRRKKSVVKNGQGSASRKPSGKSRRPGR